MEKQASLDTIGRRIAKGAGWMILLKFAVRSLGLINTLILARLLMPEDFGLIALATTIFAATEVLSSFSFDLALIQNQKATRQHYDTAWTLNVCRGLLTGMLLAGLAVPLAGVFDEPRLQWIMYILALAAAVETWENIGIVAFRKELQLHKEFRFLFTKKLITVIVSVGMALVWPNYWALVGGIIVGKVMGVLFSYGMHAYRPRFCLQCWRELVNFSKWLLLNNVLMFATGRGDDLIVGKLAGANALGLYSVGYEISNLPTTELVFPITRAVYPGYAKVADDRERLRVNFLGVFGVVVVFAIPVAVGIALTADLLVPLLLGEKWLQAVPLIQVLAFHGLIRATQANTGAIYLALAKPQLISYFEIAYVIVLIPSLVYAIGGWGALGAAYVITFTALLFMPINMYIVLKLMAMPVGRLMDAAWRPIAATAVMFLALSAMHSALAMPLTVAGLMLNVLLQALVGLVFYCLTLFTLWHISGRPLGAERHILELMARKTKARVLTRYLD